MLLMPPLYSLPITSQSFYIYLLFLPYLLQLFFISDIHTNSVKKICFFAFAFKTPTLKHLR